MPHELQGIGRARGERASVRERQEKAPPAWEASGSPQARHDLVHGVGEVVGQLSADGIGGARKAYCAFACWFKLMYSFHRPSCLPKRP